ncbi:hypothetical protein CSHISOI_01482 [Colletotrichum shisoi]|uniref:Uncharacterized protein n=1 Tax=Colletotrichum shisoi TaxID=2078593 RepID=A0A5Q4C5Z3_9PEZI|nr:hypothetical protein CSHISOI_01482 [Colletotrichum shisoi]
MAEEGVIETRLPDIVVLSVAHPHFPLAATVPDKPNGPLSDRAKQTGRRARTLDIGMMLLKNETELDPLPLPDRSPVLMSKRESLKSRDDE